MVAYPIRFLVGLLWFGIGLFWALFVIFGVLVRSLRKGPKGIISLFHRKDLQSPPGNLLPYRSNSQAAGFLLCLYGFETF